MAAQTFTGGSSDQRFGGAVVILCSQSLQSCSTLCDPMDCSLPGSSVHGILQTRILEWGAISFSSWDLKNHLTSPFIIPMGDPDRKWS